MSEWQNERNKSKISFVIGSTIKNKSIKGQHRKRKITVKNHYEYRNPKNIQAKELDNKGYSNMV